MVKPIDRLGLGPASNEEFNADGSVIVTVIPPKWAHAGDGKSVTLSQKQYKKYLEWMAGSLLIQEALPDLSDDDREILLNGT
jgi:hypothetical protein